LLNPDPPIAYAIVLDTGDKVMEELSSFTREHAVEAASITAIEAFRHASLGYFEWQTKQYKRIAVDEQVEVLSLLGDVAVAEEEPSLHLHAVLGRADGSVVSGHLLEAHVRPTLEIIPTTELSVQTKGSRDRVAAHCGGCTLAERLSLIGRGSSPKDFSTKSKDRISAPR
jgi:predicted DNA-binding protein with PD1-like motif